ncbi:MAG: hypothetical protein J5906_09210 [Acidaminococcaceae bacterium]|nr:hypothetical protein [Acidaminococcaceae bacterium]
MINIDIVKLLSMQTTSKLAVALMNKYNCDSVSDAVSFINKEINQRIKARVENSELFYNIPAIIQGIFEKNEEEYSTILCLYLDAYLQGYRNGIADLDSIANEIKG